MNLPWAHVSYLTIHEPSLGSCELPYNFTILGPNSSAVLTFIGYKLTDEQNIYIDEFYETKAINTIEKCGYFIIFFPKIS